MLPDSFRDELKFAMSGPSASAEKTAVAVEGRGPFDVLAFLCDVIHGVGYLDVATVVENIHIILQRFVRVFRSRANSS